MSPSALLKQSVEPRSPNALLRSCPQPKSGHGAGGADGLVAHRHGLDGDDARGGLAGVDLDEAVGSVLPQHRSVARPAVNDP